MKQEQWLIIDTETSGLCPPIYTVEIAAQRMCGWEPVGEPFRRLIDHDVAIDPVAELMHGYSREYLHDHGASPVTAHREFHEYAGNLPIVAYNLSFDWDQVLVPEWQRLAIPILCTRGFCAMTLARRVVPEARNLKLDTLRNHFQLGDGPAHRGLNDVQAVVRLFQTVFQQRLEASGIVGFENIAAFSRKTPVAECLALIQQNLSVVMESLPCSGPGEMASARKRRRRRFRAAHRSYHQEVVAIKTSAEELVGIGRGILADEMLNENRIMMLRDWLATCQYKHIYPMNAIALKLEQAGPDGRMTEEGKTELMGILQEAVAAFTPAYEATS
jgi:DNA polymerase III epsilon subunit-like protein